MTIIRDADDAEVEQCDGCGRTEAGPGHILQVREYTVYDPNRGETVRHHHCAHCADTRGLEPESVLIAGWTPAPLPSSPPDEAR